MDTATATKKDPPDGGAVLLPRLKSRVSEPQKHDDGDQAEMENSTDVDDEKWTEFAQLHSADDTEDRGA